MQRREREGKKVKERRMEPKSLGCTSRGGRVCLSSFSLKIAWSQQSPASVSCLDDLC